MSTQANQLTLSYPLCLGSNGSVVRALQVLLNQAGVGAALATDGRFGKGTHVALLAFQRRKGLKPDGVVGPATAKALGWSYRQGESKPYVIRYDAPPLPAMTPPVAAVAVAIRVGMGAFKELMYEGITKAYAKTNYGVPSPAGSPPAQQPALDAFARERGFKTSEDFHQRQFAQVKARLADLNWHYDKLWDSLTRLQDQAASGVAPDLAGLHSVFAYFVSDMRSSLRAMSLLSGDTLACEQALEQLSYQHLLSIVERVLRGEQTALMAISQIGIAFDNANRTLAARLRS